MAMETAQEQDLAFERLRLLGDYQHNCDVLALGEGELIVVRMPKNVEEGIALTTCLALVVWVFLWPQSSGGTDKIAPIGPKRLPQNGRGYSKKLSFYYQQLYCPPKM